MRKEKRLNEENGKRTNMKKGEDIKKWNKCEEEEEMSQTHTGEM